MAEQATQRNQSMMDKPNGNLKVGDIFRITAWCGEMEMYTPSPFSFFAFGGDGDGSREPKKRPTDGTVYKVLALDYPNMLARAFRNGNSNTLELDMREFESVIADGQYARAMFKVAEGSSLGRRPTCTWCAIKAWWRRDRSED